MEDYYKILGVKENASEKEIRARWIELTKHYHPDLSKGNKSEQKIKEINEAYQTLKFSSNRMEYDLKRNYEREKRRLYIKRISPYGILFVLLIILCTLFIGKPQVPSLRKLEPVTYHLKGTPQTPSIKENEMNRRNETEQIKQISPQPKSEVVVKLEKVVPKSSLQTIFESETSVKDEKVVPKEITKITEVISQESLKIISEEVSKVEEVKPIIKEIGSPPPLVQPENPVGSPSYVASAPLIAREEEVRQFFINYIDRYTRKDIDGFLSFFSSKAIQNQKGFDEIKRVYTIYFKESEELRYELQDLKIENQPNNVEVTANYKVDQVLKKRGEKKVWKGHIRWILVKEDDVLKILSLDYQHKRST